MPVTIASGQVQQKFGTVFNQVLMNEDVIVERLQQASNMVAQRAARLEDAEIDDLIEEARKDSQPEVGNL